MTPISSNEGVIEPTRTCFDDAVDFCFELMKEDRSIIFSDRIKIVHGILKRENGQLLSHAWVEMEELVHHTGILHGKKAVFGFEREAYYKEMQVQESVSYTILDCARLEKQHGYPGPWIPKYRELCRDYEQNKLQQDILSFPKRRTESKGQVPAKDQKSQA